MSTATIVFISSILVYFDPNMKHSIIALIIFNIQFDIYITRATAMGFSGLILFAITSYLKYQFRQINEEIEDCVKRRKYYLLMNAINKHQMITELTKSVNSFFCWQLGATY